MRFQNAARADPMTASLFFIENPMRSKFLILISCVALSAAGCASQEGDSGPRFRVSGDVKYDGKPVPYGEVLFTPDGSKGNNGAQGIATIKNGKYDTRGSRAPGSSGGPTVVRVTALSDSAGKLLTEHEFNIDLPKADTEHNIDIPAKAAAKPTEAKPALPEI